MAYFFLVEAASTFGLWGPQFLQDVAKTDLKGIGTALGGIFLVGTISTAACGSAADHAGRRGSIRLGTLALGCVGVFGAAAFAASPTPAVLAFGAGVVGHLASFPVFWGSMTSLLAPAAASAAIALVNSVGNLGGAIGTAVVGPIKQNMGLVPAVAGLGMMMAPAVVFAAALGRR